MEKNIECKNIIDLIYKGQEKCIDNIMIKVNKELENKLKGINLEKILENTENSEDIKKLLNKIEDNYSIRILEYNKEMYKQGVIDGVNLMCNCLEK